MRLLQPRLPPVDGPPEDRAINQDREKANETASSHFRSFSSHGARPCLDVGNALSQQKSLKEQLTGAWTLVSNDNVAPDGTKRQLYGPNPKGILILDASGRYAQIYVRADLPKFKANNRQQGTPEENAAVVHGTTAQLGTWSVDEGSKTLMVHIEGSLFPNHGAAWHDLKPT